MDLPFSLDVTLKVDLSLIFFQELPSEEDCHSTVIVLSPSTSFLSLLIDKNLSKVLSPFSVSLNFDESKLSDKFFLRSERLLPLNIV